MRHDIRVLWIDSFFISLFIYGCSLIYGLLYEGSVHLGPFSEALAATGGILIGLSFALSGLTYYFNFLDPQIKYRKYFGLIGYFYAVAYAFSLLYRYPETYLSPTTYIYLDTDVLLGLLAMGIFTLMALISNSFMLTKLGGRTWRRMLRMGYIAYALLIVRAYYLESHIWLAWSDYMDTLPPPRLLLSLFALVVIALRLCLEFSLRTKKKTLQTPPPFVSSVVPAPHPQVSPPRLPSQSFPSSPQS